MRECGRYVIRSRTLVGVVLAVSALRASEIEVVPVRPFGQLIRGCHVAGFTAHSEGSKPALDLKGHFEGMIGRDIPYGKYEMVLECGPWRQSRQITVDRSRQIEVFEGFGTIYAGDGPFLVIGVERRHIPDDALYWVQVLSVYDGTRQTAAISRQTGEGELLVPSNGSYVFVASSNGGDQCAIEVDVVQFTRRWVLHPDTCTLDVDRFAHVVTRSDKLDHRRGGWYLEMEKEQNTFFRQLEKAAEETRRELSDKP